MNCDYCAEEIPDGSDKCPSCGESLYEDEAPPSGRTGTVVIVVAVLVFACVIGGGLLTAILVPALSSAKGKAQVAVTRSHLNALRAAMAAYESDTGRLPRLLPRTEDDRLLEDDAAALHAALVSPRGQGGGPNAPYLQDWPAQSLSTTKPTLLLDSWGNPYHYREWASVRMSAKDSVTLVRQVGGRGISDLAQSPESYDLWSNGPNGLNEYGAPGSDDIVSWR